MWAKFNSWFKDSETIVWARVQMFVGALWIAASSTDLSPIFPSKYLPVWLVISGAITEYLRRRRDPNL